ncbi:MAG: metallophosphoesterase [Verrucomicrobia bacterium]|nr:metallophosphoesterase [Verrucomicrobiota bacterium]
MRMLFVADLHYALKQFDWLIANAAKDDPIAIGGDLLSLNSALDLDVQIVVMEKYLHRLSQRTRVLVSSGNHDLDACNPAGEGVARWLQEAKTKNLFVDGDTVELSGARVTICPWWDGPVSRAEVEAQLAREADGSNGRWLWLHHAAPAGSRVCWTGRRFAGDEVLTAWIKRFNPDMVLCGHVHNAPFYPKGAWVDRIGKTWVFNPGRQPGPCPARIWLDLDAQRAEWISLEGRSVRQLAPAAS